MASVTSILIMDASNPQSSIRAVTLRRATAHTYEFLHAEEGTTVLVVLKDRKRSLARSLVADIGRRRMMYPGLSWSSPTAQVMLPTDTFWRLASGSVPRWQAIDQSRLTGDQHFAGQLFDVVSVVR